MLMQLKLHRDAIAARKGLTRACAASSCYKAKQLNVDVFIEVILSIWGCTCQVPHCE